jgi:hypothetical protein
MNGETNRRVVDFPPLEFLISLDPERFFVVREKHGRSSGVFDELSSAIQFVRDECQAVDARRSSNSTKTLLVSALRDDFSC